MQLWTAAPIQEILRQWNDAATTMVKDEEDSYVLEATNFKYLG